MKIKSIKKLSKKYICFDLEVRNHHNFIANNIVVHNSNCRVLCKDGEIYVGSRNFWKADMPGSIFWKAFRNDPALEKFVRDNPQYMVFGEAYGDVKGFKYDCAPGEIKFAVFDIFSLAESRWLDYNNARQVGESLHWTPHVATFAWNLEYAIKLSSGPSTLPCATNIREGIVVSPNEERISTAIGRVKLKIVSPDF